MESVTTILTSGKPPSDISHAPILTPQRLGTFTAERTFDDALVFETSGSSGTAKRVPYSKHAREIQKTRQAECFTTTGVTETDTVMNLGAPWDPHKHLSGWHFEHGTKTVGATLANTSVDDYEAVIEAGKSHQVTVVAGLPQTMRAVGHQIETTHGPLEHVFPDLRLGFIGGDLLTSNLKAQLREQWDFDEIRNVYAATEAGAVAAALDDTNQLRPVADESLILEVLPEHDSRYGSEPVNIHDVEEEIRGTLLISDLERDIVPIVRYRIGDIVTVYPEYPSPRIEVHGREGETMLLGGALLYPSQIDGALADTYPASPPKWVAVVSQPNEVDPALDIFVIDDSVTEKPDTVRQQLLDRSSPVKEVYDLAILDHLDIHYATASDIKSRLQAFDLANEVLNDGTKTSRIGFDRSYEGVIT